MSFEQKRGTLLSEINRQAGKKTALVYEKTFQEAFQELCLDEGYKTKLAEQLLSDTKAKRVRTKTKQYLREQKSLSRERIKDVVYRRNLQIRGMTQEEFITQAVERTKGMDILAPLMNSISSSDPYGIVTNVFCLDYKTIYYESSKTRTPKKFEGQFDDENHYKNFVNRLLEEVGKTVDTGEHKIVDFDLYEDRYQVLSDIIAPRGLSLTIRVHQEEHIKLEDLLQSGVMSRELADFIGLLYKGKLNTIVAGITGTGKTTTLRAVLDHYLAPSNERILTCEDTRELFLENDHTLELTTSAGDGEHGVVTLRDLNILALRQKPDYIIIGEVRGVEAESAVEGAETGHSTHFTMHAGKAIDAINRLETKYLQQMPSLSMDVVERIIGSAIDYIIIQDNIPNIGRKITSVTEVTYDYESRRIQCKPIWEYNFFTKEQEQLSGISKEKGKDMMRHGISPDIVQKYLAEEKTLPILKPNI